MHRSPSHPRLRERFSELQRDHHDAGRGFVCILDLRRKFRRSEPGPSGSLSVWAAVLIFVILFAATRTRTGLSTQLDPSDEEQQR